MLSQPANLLANFSLASTVGRPLKALVGREGPLAKSPAEGVCVCAYFGTISGERRRSGIMASNFREPGGDQDYSCLPLPGLHEHFGQVLSYEKMTAGTAAIEQECAMDPALGELRQHLLRHHISFCVFDSKCRRDVLPCLVVRCGCLCRARKACVLVSRELCA